MDEYGNETLFLDSCDTGERTECETSVGETEEITNDVPTSFGESEDITDDLRTSFGESEGITDDVPTSFGEAEEITEEVQTSFGSDLSKDTSDMFAESPDFSSSSQQTIKESDEDGQVMPNQQLWCSTPRKDITEGSTGTCLSLDVSPIQASISPLSISNLTHNSEVLESALYADLSSQDEVNLANQPGKKNPRKRRLKFFERSFNSLGKKECCNHDCLKHITIHEVNHYHSLMSDKNETEQRQYIMDQMYEHSSVSWIRRKPIFQSHFMIAGKRVCEKAWCELHRVSEYRFSDCKRKFVNGERRVVHGNTGKGKKREKTTVALGWMRFLFSRIGDYMPHKSQIHLPVSLTKKALYERMCQDLLQQGLEKDMIICYEHFASIWRNHLPEFIIPKVSEFTKCSVCTELDEALQKHVGDDARDSIAKLRDDHLKLVTLERDAYHEERSRARVLSDDVTCIIIDGMDQAKTSLPHFVTWDKNTRHLAFLPVHVTGVLIHTSVPAGKIPMVFLDVKDVPHDSNLTINVLVRALVRAKHKLGRSLFLQLDNCYRENKNRYLLSFVSHLVELDVFKEVVVHFLPVGHTHEDVDQLFRCIAGSLKVQYAHTMEDLRRIIEGSYTPSIEVEDCGFLYDVKSWIIPHLAGKFGNHSKPHWFRFVVINNAVRMTYKLWRNDPWEPSAGPYEEGLCCLETSPYINSVPDWVQPSLERVDMEGLRKDIPGGYSRRMSLDCQASWNQLLDRLEERMVVPEVNVTWPLHKLMGNADAMQSQPAPLPPNVEDIRNQMATRPPAVYIGQQGRTHASAVREVAERNVTVGMLVAISLEDQSEYVPPYIGKVIKVDAENVTIHWMRGTYTTSWKPWNVRIGRTMKPYTDVVDVASIILYDFVLTSIGSKLKKQTVEALKVKYQQ